MDSVTQKIERVTQELREIEHDMMWTELDDPDTEKLRFLDEAHSTRLLTDLKIAVDGMRRFLWAYIEAADRYRGAGLNYALQTARLRRATEMLHILHEDLPDLQREEARSLLERVTQMLRKHQEREKKG